MQMQWEEKSHIASDRRYVNHCNYLHCNYNFFFKWPHVYIQICIWKTVLGFSFVFLEAVCMIVYTFQLCHSVKKQIFIFRPQRRRFSLFPSSLPLAPVSFSPPSLCSCLLLPLSPPSPLDWWSKHRKRAGSVPPRQSWAFLQSSCAGGQKFTVVFISPFLSQSQRHTTAPELWPRQRILLKRWSDASNITAPPPISDFSPYYFFSFLSTG